MSFKTRLIKWAIKLAMKWTPKTMILWVPNIVLKGIAELTDFSFDIEARKAYVQTQLYGETEMIEVSFEGFAVLSDAEGHKFIVQQAQSNRPWLHNLLARIVGKAWKIPVIPQLEPHMGLISELFKPETPAEEGRPVLEGHAIREDQPVLENQSGQEDRSAHENYSV